MAVGDLKRNSHSGFHENVVTKLQGWTIAFIDDALD